jgi:hypothetical protein
MTPASRCSICHIFPVVSPIRPAGATGSSSSGICDMCFVELTCPAITPASTPAQPQLRAVAQHRLADATGARARLA